MALTLSSKVVSRRLFLQTRLFRSSRVLQHNKSQNPSEQEIHVHYITADGERVTVGGVEGDNLLDLAHANSIDLEGACEGSVACSTCHVIVQPEFYAKLPEPTDDENDMLDLAFGLTETSRLGCQVILNPGLHNMTVRLPSATRNMAVDGYKPKPH